MKRLLATLSGEIRLFGTSVNIDGNEDGDIADLIAKRVEKYNDGDVIISESVPF